VHGSRNRYRAVGLLIALSKISLFCQPEGEIRAFNLDSMHDFASPETITESMVVSLMRKSLPRATTCPGRELSFEQTGYGVSFFRTIIVFENTTPFFFSVRQSLALSFFFCIFF
jgi:hypothetical protein